jgi:phage gpG-like protein
MALFIDDSKWRKIVADVAQIATQVAKVGVLQDGETEADGMSMVELAAIHEFGTEHVPERSFIRSTFATKQREAATLAERLAKAIVLRGMPIGQALGLLGAWGASAVKATITEGDGVPPPLAPATIARKGSSRPLVDTGRLLASITWEVGEVEP